MKGPVTESYLLHLAKKLKTQDIKSIDLSNHNLDSLDENVLNSLSSLEALDLSWNHLTCIPENLSLKKLHVLDCSNNDLSTVEFVRQFDQLDELYFDDNDNLQIDDIYIAKALCPKLRRINEMSDLKNITQGIKLFTDQLTPQIEAVWEAKYTEVYSSGIIQEEMAQLHTDFVQAVNNTILTFHSDLPAFRKFMIEKISRDLMEEVNKKKDRKENGDPNTSMAGRTTPSSKYRTRIKLGNTPVKDYSQGVPMDVSEISKKRKRDSSSNESPSLKKKRTHTPDKKVTPQRDRSECLRIPKKDTLVKETLPSLPDYDPVQFVRCHSDNNNPSDSDTKIWKCSFEPQIGEKGETTDTVATCGGCTVCFIDCHTCKVMRRYKDNSDTESFYSLAWTTLPADGDKLKENANILAVAGQDGVVKLIYPRQLVKYATLTGHRDYISTLVFHPSEPNILFSGSRDGRIIQWDIGVPDFKDYKSTTWSQLSVLRLNKTDAISMVISPDLNILLAGCENSCFGWNLQHLGKREKEKSPDFEFIHPRQAGDTDDLTTVDSLSLFNSRAVVSKCVDSSSLYLWDLERSLKKAKKSSGCSRVQLASLQQLDYVPVDVDYLYTCASKDVLAIGDDQGNIHMYNLKNELRQKSFTENRLLQASNILQYAELEICPKFETDMDNISEDVVVNCVCLSSSQDYLVCGTDNNLVCVWKKQ